MTDKVFPLRPRIPIGVDAQGRPVLPSTDFIKQWEDLFKRVGEYTALTNVQLEALVYGGSLSDVVMQPAQAQAGIDAIMQPPPPLQSFDDITQPASCGFFVDQIFQG